MASDSAVDYVVDGVEQHTDGLLALLKAKEERLQIEVNKCAELRAENIILTKQLQVSTARQVALSAAAECSKPDSCTPYQFDHLAHWFWCSLEVGHQ